MVFTQEQPKVQAAQPAEFINQLQIEQKVLLNKIHQQGFELGIRSTSKLSYKDFQHFERVQIPSHCFR
ncbi:hypothetical protein [Pantanalinema sp. GBBB05]|uniref:hypothetical protein n=1 Tax=Pantanalinema sp. GBBB05 TaxID=2604139 RepID=UPI001D870974|nr:hypothetical protein [Pantanalinema sp. GBBB05]